MSCVCVFFVCAELLEKLLCDRTTPSLALVEDINVVCSCLKYFLRVLAEPLVTFALRPEFIEAGKMFQSDRDYARSCAVSLIHRLPVAHRDTLAFIMLHLKVRIACGVCCFLVCCSSHLKVGSSYFSFICRLCRGRQRVKWERLIWPRYSATRWLVTRAVIRQCH